MSQALASLPTPTAPRRRGRPPVAGDASERAKHVEAATMLLRGTPASRVARAFDVSLRTVYYWFHKAHTYAGPEADVLHRRAR